MMKQLLLVALLIVGGLSAAAGKDSITISGYFRYLTDRDSVTLRVYDYYHTSYNLNAEKIYQAKVKGNSFIFHIPQKGVPQYVDLILPNGTEDSTRNLTLYSYLLTDGDSIHYSDRIKDHFAGKRAEKWRIRNQLEKIYIFYASKASQFEGHSIKSTFSASIMDTLLLRQLALIELYKNTLSRQTYDLLKADAVASTIAAKLTSLSYMNAYNKNAVEDFHDSGITDSLLSSLSRNKEMLYSHDYYSAILGSFKILCFSKKQTFEIQNCYNYIRENFSFQVAEKAITGLLYDNRNRSSDISEIIPEALSWTKDENFKRILSNLQQTRLKGASAKNFELPDPKGKIVKLSDLRGKVLVMDFWYTGCGGCAGLAPKLVKIKKQLSNKDVIFVSISADKSKEIWLKSIKQGIYTDKSNTNLLAEGLRYNHPVLKDYSVTGFPTLILIDKQGKIMNNPVDPGKDEGKSLISIVKQGLAE
ncbi:TlpA family protein disulfide reductase [Chryseobacterium populi]|uniref:Peroxiredoxin n=1 Tax=Chryseobacterium populi TaxID=1144316 RepID=J3CMA6_9FLAO|nr:TlpA disulfide reductase family protein [Chryseobacterium populi]EJL74381.1 Peroxiredoxin [Chryseobacterium populi]